MRHCIFCNGRATTSEHAWPEWLIESLGRATRAEAWLGPDAERREWGGAPVEAKYLCAGCNNGWMCDLEGQVRLFMGAMMHDLSLRLDRTQQHLLAAWCMKTTMVFECTKPDKAYFYTKAEREQLRSSLSIPDSTMVWLGRQHRSNFTYCDARKVSESRPREKRVLSEGYVTTFAAGRLVLQTITLRRDPEWLGRLLTLDANTGPWAQGRGLVKAWPPSPSLRWPPGWSFDEPDLEPFSARFRMQQ